MSIRRSVHAGSRLTAKGATATAAKLPKVALRLRPEGPARLRAMGQSRTGCRCGIVRVGPQRVEPGNSIPFTRMAAIGAEQKLVSEIGCFRFCPETATRPGDGFRTKAWQSTDTVQVRISMPGGSPRYCARLKRANAHLLATAYLMLEGRGALLTSRLGQDFE
jgi:hypothetical protein